MKALALILFGLISVQYTPVIAGTDSTNTPTVFQLNSVVLAPESLVVTLLISTPRKDLFYGIEAHDGPLASNATWQVLQERPGTGATLTFIDDVSRSLTPMGKTYRGFVSRQFGAPASSRVPTVNEEFISCPLLSSPQVTTVQMTGSSNELRITTPVITGIDPTNTPTVFQLERVELDPDTFTVTLVINTPRDDLFYGVQAHNGPPVSNTTWQVLQERRGTGSSLTFTDDVSGSLTHTGKTYRGFVSLQSGAPSNSWVTTVNEEFISYPFLSSPQVAVQMTGSTNELRITYGEGIYSNQIQYTFPAGQAIGFFRLNSTDNDPVNAQIQVKTNFANSTWNNVSEP